MSSVYGGMFRIKDLGGRVSEAVTARRKEMKKVGLECTGQDKCGVLQTSSLERGMGYQIKRNG